jgi:hypothetical protein
MKKRQQANGQYAHSIPSLMDETPISFYPSLAEVVGVNEAIVLQQIWFYINVNRENESDRHFHNGKWWVYNSYKQWSKKFFRWLTPRGVQSIILHLEELKILESAQGVSDKYDRRKWYTVNRAALNALLEDHYTHDTESALSHSAENAPSIMQNLHPLNVQKMHDEKTENTTEITTERTKETTSAATQQYANSDQEFDAMSVEELVDILNAPDTHVINGKSEKSAPAENRKQGKAKATTAPAPSPLPAPAPVAVDDVERFSGKLDAAKGTKGKGNRMATIIDTAWRKTVSGYLLPQLMGKADKPDRKPYNLTPACTEAEIWSFCNWWRSTHPAHIQVPTKGSSIHDAIIEYRGLPDYERRIADAEYDVGKMFPRDDSSKVETAPAPEIPMATPEQMAEAAANFSRLVEAFTRQDVS